MPKPRSNRRRKSKSKSQGSVNTSDEEGWYTIRAILDERLVNGRVEYLVDWDDNKETGKTYLPTWSCEVTDIARDEWEKKKSSHATEANTQDSQPPRPANWRQLQRSQIPGPSSTSRRRKRSSTEDGTGRPSKTSRIAFSATPSEEPVPSIVSISSPVSVDDPDGFDYFSQRELDAQQPQRLIVELQKKSDFDPSDYATQENTQSSGQSSQSIAELEEQDERNLFTSQLTRQTIPDSQEPSGQTWSQDQQPTDFALSSQAESSEAQSQPPVESQFPVSVDQHTDGFSGERDSRNSIGGDCHLSERSDVADIPSHQFGQVASPSTASQDFNLTTPATKPHSVQSNGDQDFEAIPASSPVFFSQVDSAALFHLPESSVSGGSQLSPIKSAVAETPSDPKQDSASTWGLATNFAPESQDAQIFQINPFISHVEAFSDSHETTNAPATLHPNASHTVSQQSEPLFTMEGQDASESVNQTPQASAVDELSQIFNLDNVMAEGTCPNPPESGEQPRESETSATSPGFRGDHQEQQQPPAPGDESAGLQSEQTKSNHVSSSRDSAVAAMKNIVDAVFANPDPDLPASGTMMPDPAHNPDLGTVSLADISKQPDLTAHALPLMPSLLPHDNLSSAPVDSSGVSVPGGQPQQEEDSDDSSDGSQEPITLKHIITLPFQASLRPLYDDTLLESKREVTQFGAIFNSEEYVEPDEALVQKIDQLFSQLHNICDYPPDAVGSVLEDLPSDQLIKYCCDANPKFNFIYEILQGLTKETRVLIVARSTDLLRLLYRLTGALQIECVCDEIGKPKSEYASSTARVTLILPGKNVEEDDFDLVIGYDHSFGGSEIGKKLEPEIPEARSPLVLILVTTHSIEHIDLYISDELSPLERKNALLSGIVRSRQLVSDPDRGYPEPHELASLFLDYLNGQVEGVIWEPIPVPEEVMDIYLSSQSRSQMPIQGTPEPENARKRKLDDSDDEDVKRMRMLPHQRSTVQTNEAPVPDDVKALLDSVNLEETAIKSSRVHINVPVAVLQALAEQNAELKRQLEASDRDAEYKGLIASLETRLKEYGRTTEKVYSSQRAALEDRATFERETRKAEANLLQANETAHRESEKAQKKIVDLEATIVRLTTDPSNPEEPSPLSKTQTLLQESQEKMLLLEKRLENAHKDADYARSLYQDATTTSSALRGENADLKEQVSDLSKKTEETLGNIHRIQAENTTKSHLRQIRDLKTQLREREIELDCTKEELRTLKNGRRETRQVSVPRSPRMGMMSPRTGRANYGSAGGSTSRGTSPAPTSGDVAGSVLAGMQFLGQPPNGRWNHLRD